MQVPPAEGEIDIVEGANNLSAVTTALHTIPSCTMATNRRQTGQATSATLRLNRDMEHVARTDNVNDCDTNKNFNAGCGANTVNPKSFGRKFNAAGSGIYAIERTPVEIKA